MVITHEAHEANSQAWSGVNTTADVSTYLKIFFPAITDDAVQQALNLYPESGYTSPGLRFADMKQSFDLTAHNLAVTNALKNQTWNGLVALGGATHGTDQSYYCTLPSPTPDKPILTFIEQGIAPTPFPPLPPRAAWPAARAATPPPAPPPADPHPA